MLLPSAPHGPVKGAGDPLCAACTVTVDGFEPLAKLGLVFPSDTVIEVAPAVVGEANVAIPSNAIGRQILFIVGTCGYRHFSPVSLTP